jgi:hypothetical protein
MILRSALAAGVLALQASAFLVPLEVTKEVEAAKARLESLWWNQAHTVELSCPGCTFPGPQQDGIEYSSTDENTIVSLIDSIASAPDRRYLTRKSQEITVLVEHMSSVQINGQTVFSLNAMVAPPALTASQIRVSDSTPSRPLRLGYALEVLPPVSFENEKTEIVTLQLTILDLEGAPVHVDTLKIDLLKNVGGLSVAKISNIPFAQSPGATECTTSLCRLRAIIIARVHTMLEAAKARAHTAGAWIKSGCRGKNGGSSHGQTASDRPHHRHHGHHKMHRFGHILHQTLRFFIIPALLGVIGGLMASAVGMLVGQALVYMWFRFHRGGQRGNLRIVEVALSEDEKDALVETEDLPPQYEDVEAVIVEDAKE